MKKITLKELLKVMSIETFRKLKSRGKIQVVTMAPLTQIDVETLPIRIQAALSHLPTA